MSGMLLASASDVAHTPGRILFSTDPSTGKVLGDQHIALVIAFDREPELATPRFDADDLTEIERQNL